jgi:hypothetical protein
LLAHRFFANPSLSLPVLEDRGAERSRELHHIAPQNSRADDWSPGGKLFNTGGNDACCGRRVSEELEAIHLGVG